MAAQLTAVNFVACTAMARKQLVKSPRRKANALTEPGPPHLIVIKKIRLIRTSISDMSIVRWSRNDRLWKKIPKSGSYPPVKQYPMSPDMLN